MGRGVKIKIGSELRIDNAISKLAVGTGAELELELEGATGIWAVQHVIQKSRPTSPLDCAPPPFRLRAHQALDRSAGAIPSVE